MTGPLKIWPCFKTNRKLETSQKVQNEENRGKTNFWSSKENPRRHRRGISHSETKDGGDWCGNFGEQGWQSWEKFENFQVSTFQFSKKSQKN